MPTIDTSFDVPKTEFRQKMFAEFLKSDYWEANLEPVDLHHRFSKYCCDVFFELIEEQKESIRV